MASSCERGGPARKRTELRNVGGFRLGALEWERPVESVVDVTRCMNL